MNADQVKKLRAPFKPEQIGQLPKPTKKENPKGRCDVCGGYHGLPAIHLDYVGHAHVTNRLLEVDPDWTWWPMALDERGMPMLDAKGGLWITLKIGDVQRPGYGDGDSMKEIIGDAIRNAAMRFGVALDLWAKEPLHTDSENGDKPLAARKKPAAKPKAWKPRPAQVELLDAAKDANVDDTLRHRITQMLTGKDSVKDMTDAECKRVTEQLAWFQMNRAAGMKALEEWEAS